MIHRSKFESNYSCPCACRFCAPGRTHITAFLASVLIVVAHVEGQPLRYIARDLGTLGGPTAQAFAINSAGHVAGGSTRSDANVHAFVWDGIILDLPPLSHDLQATAFAINDLEEVAAVSYDLGELTPHGVLWRTSGPVDLGNLAPRDLNSAGMVVGSMTINDATFGWVERAASWQNASVSDLGTLGGHFSRASAANEFGDVVGMSFSIGDVATRATLWKGGVGRDLGTLGGPASYAYDINDSGQVVGTADTVDGFPRAFLFELDGAGQVNSRTNLGVLGGTTSFALGINNGGQIVGTSDARAFVWIEGTMFDLNTTLNPIAAWQLEQGWAVNNGGLIVGAGMHFGMPRAFLLTPGTSGDANGDSLLSAADYSAFVECLRGPAEGAAVSCYIEDFDGDGDIDLRDFSGFQQVLRIAD